jgi:filamentous hemagglutinin family protein
MDRYSNSSILFIALFLSLLASTFCKADIITDGSLGEHVDLVGPDYHIPADLGQIIESNLFHSFEEFNISSGESGTFLGPNHVENIVARITGQDPSVVNGLLASDIPGANLFLINPFGIIFGANAELNINGSFYAGTADYLRFADGGVFHADPSRQSTLSVARPEAFGFLTANPDPVLITDSDLKVPSGETLSFMGGNIEIHGTDQRVKFHAGELQLMGVGTTGEVNLDAPDLLNTTAGESGDINITNADFIIGGETVGRVIIKGGRIEIDNADIISNNSGDVDPEALGIEMESFFQIKLSNNSSLTTYANGAGKSGDISVKSENLEIETESEIVTKSSAYGSCGSININATESVVIDSCNVDYRRTGIFSDQTSSDGKAAGDITISTDTLAITNSGSGIGTTSMGKEDAGAITIDANHVIMDDGDILATVVDGNSGSISIRADTFTAANDSSLNAQTDGEGNGSNINIQADQMTLQNNTTITSTSYGQGDAGNIDIQVATTLDLMDSVITTEATQADGGEITLCAGDIIHLINSDVTATVDGGVNTIGGNVELQSTNIILNKSKVIANAFEGQGGNIDIIAKTYLTDPVSVVDASSELGIDGTVDIQAPLNNLSGIMKPLSTEFLSAASLLKEPCEARVKGGDYGSFTIKGRDALPMEPGALHMSPPVDF